MAGERILIVEDEQIVAEDLRDMLKHLGYQVAGMASSGEEAIRKAEETQPDLILMDIRLNGEMDGIEAAEVIWTNQAIPVTYLTAYADESTLERAKATMPFGYILKPFEERDLRTSIEIALYKHSMDSVFGKMEGWYAATLGSLSEPIIATNTRGSIIFMNPAAESLTGWFIREIYGKKFNEVFEILSDKKKLNDDPIADVLAQDPSASARVGILTIKDGSRIRAEFVMTPITEKDGHLIGNVVVVRNCIRQPESQKA